MKETFRASMAWLHSWAGLLLGWVLYFMFITGTAGYLDTELDRWMQPELPPAAPATDPASAAERALALLAQRAPQAERWFISLPSGREALSLSVFWQGGKGTQASGSMELDMATESPVSARATGGGQFLYRLHWQLHYLPRGVSYWIVGVATMFMLVALITGVVVHKKIFVDFFTFRPNKGQRSWLDAHNVVSAATLPFQLMITWSGLIFLMFTYLPWVVAAWYGPGDAVRKAFFDEVFGPPALVEASGETAPLVALDRVVVDAQRLWGGAPIASLDIRHPNDAHARIIVRGSNAAGVRSAADLLVYDGANGQMLAWKRADGSAAKGFRDMMIGLHEGLFAGPLLRTLYVLSGLLGAAMIATGLVQWAVKRRQRIEKARAAPHFGLRLVEKLNVAAIVGLPVAIAAYFWANRLLPLELANRAGWEAHSLFLVWLAMFLHATLRPAARVWVEQCWLAAAVFGLLPLLNALTTDRHLAASLLAGDWVFAGFDLAMLVLGLVFAAMAWRISRGAHRQQRAPDVPRRLVAGRSASAAE